MSRSLISKGVSDILYDHIRSLMAKDYLVDFSLGGGTNLSIKYNHRVSTDIDLFSKEVIGSQRMKEISIALKIELRLNAMEVRNGNSENLSFLRTLLEPDKTRVEIIQNLKNISPPEIIQGVRLIHDDDIGALKLLSVADRGVQKDFYDVYLLTEIKPLSYYFNHLIRYYEGNKDAPANIFDNIGALGARPGFDLTKNLSPLCDFNHAGDKSNSSNRIIFTENSPINIPWPVLRNKWKAKVIQLAKERDIRFKETPTRKKPNFSGGWLK